VRGQEVCQRVAKARQAKVNRKWKNPGRQGKCQQGKRQAVAGRAPMQDRPAGGPAGKAGGGVQCPMAAGYKGRCTEGRQAWHGTGCVKAIRAQ